MKHNKAKVNSILFIAMLLITMVASYLLLAYIVQDLNLNVGLRLVVVILLVIYTVTILISLHETSHEKKQEYYDMLVCAKDKISDDECEIKEKEKPKSKINKNVIKTLEEGWVELVDTLADKGYRHPTFEKSKTFFFTGSLSAMTICQSILQDDTLNWQEREDLFVRTAKPHLKD